MRIPNEGLAEWALALRDACMQSSATRRGVYARQRAIYAAGSSEPVPHSFNATGPAVDRLAGMLFAPQKVSFLIQYSAPADAKAAATAQLASRVLTSNFLAARAHMTFGQAVAHAITAGIAVLKVRRDGSAFRVDEALPENIGVLRETDGDLAGQEAVCEASYPLASEVARSVRRLPDGDALAARVWELAGAPPAQSAGARNQISVGTSVPIGSAGQGTLITGARAAPLKPSATMAATVERIELWVRDDDRGGRYSTIQVIPPDLVLIGREPRGNGMLPPSLPDAPTELQDCHPYVAIVPFPVLGSVWGASLVDLLSGTQGEVNLQRTLIARARMRKRRPVVGLSGFSGITEEQYEAILTRGKLLVADNPNAKAAELPSPDLAPLYEALSAELALMDRLAGFPPVLRGEGEGSVRSQGHAETLVRTASPRLTSPAIEVESALAETATLGFRLMQVYDGLAYAGDEAGEFVLADIPPGWHMTADGHSSTPVFSEDEKLLTLDLARMGVLAPTDIIRMLRLPDADLLEQHAKERAAAMARMEQERAAKGEKPESPKPRR